MKKLSNLIAGNPAAVIAVIAIMTVVMAFFAIKVKINPDIIDYLPKTDKIVQDFDRVGEDYGGSLTAFIVFESDDVFSRESLMKIDRITKLLQETEGVNIVTSLTNVMDIKEVDGSIEIAPLFENDSLMSDTAYVRARREYVMGERIYRGKLISSDMTKALIVMNLADEADQTETCEKIKTDVKNLEITNKIHFGGLPFFVLEVNRLIVKDLLKLILPCALLMIIVLFLSFRTAVGVIVPLLNVLVSTVWTIGIMSALKVDVTIITNIIPVVLLAVGSAYSIHVISKFYEEMSCNKNKKDAASEAIRDVALPVFLAAVTTLIGFLSFVFGSYLTMIRDFGIFSAVGVGISFILSLTLTPALLIVFKSKAGGKDNGTKSFLFVKMVEWFIPKRKFFLVLVAAMTLISVILIPKISRSSDIMDYFKKESEIRVSDKIIEEHFGGSTRIQVICAGDMTKTATLREMWELEKFLEDSAGVRNISSIVDVVKRMNMVIEGNYNLPDSDEKLANLYFLTDGEPFVERMLKSDKSEALIEGSLASGMKLKNVTDFINKVKERMDRDFKEVSFSLTGMPSVNVKLDRSILQSTLFSIAMSIILVFVLLSFMLGSARLSLKGTLPILFTILTLFGVMSALKLSLDIATCLLGSISIGIGIDYSVHYLIRLRKELKDGKKYGEAVHATMMTTGRAIATNVFTVAAGFSVLMLSSLQPIVNFGFLIAVTMLIAGATAVIMLSVSSKEKGEEK
ncbi:MAG: efflux RND transporter permease subunit [bacterium]|nr:efflux RND transporter permease subunit [bacterium]